MNIGAMWTAWMQQHWPNAKEEAQRKTWDLTVAAVAWGRQLEREGADPLRGLQVCKVKESAELPECGNDLPCQIHGWAGYRGDEG